MAASKRSAPGFTLLEFLLVVVIVGILIGIASTRLLFLLGEAERTAMEQTVSALREGVTLQFLSLVAAGHEEKIAELVGRNPMDFAMRPPPNYLGVLQHPDPAQIPPRHWYFDASRGLLVYRVRYTERFETSLPGPPRARFRIRLLFDDANHDGRYEASRDRLFGVDLVAAEPYRWDGAAPAPRPRAATGNSRPRASSLQRILAFGGPSDVGERSGSFALKR